MSDFFCVSGDENYDNFQKYGTETFQQLEDLNRNGFEIEGHKHEMKLKCMCDWKASACIEGLVSPTGRYFCKFCLCTKDVIGDLSSKYSMFSSAYFNILPQKFNNV